MNAALYLDQDSQLAASSSERAGVPPRLVRELSSTERLATRARYRRRKGARRFSGAHRRRTKRIDW